MNTLKAGRDRKRSQKIAEDRAMFYLLRSFAIVCDQLRSCDHIETIESFAICDQNVSHNIFTHDSTHFSNKAQNSLEANVYLL